MVKPQALAACPPFAYPTLERVLGTDLELIPVNRLADAEGVLERTAGLSVVICGVYFDESRMYDLLRYVRRRFPKLPFICVRLLNAELPQISRNAIEIAASTLGAAAYVDFPDLVAQRGEQVAEQELRRAVLEQLTRSRTQSGAYVGQSASEWPTRAGFHLSDHAFITALEIVASGRLS